MAIEDLEASRRKSNWYVWPLLLAEEQNTYCRSICTVFQGDIPDFVGSFFYSATTLSLSCFSFALALVLIYIYNTS